MLYSEDNNVVCALRGAVRHFLAFEFCCLYTCLYQSRLQSRDIRSLTLLLFTETCLWAIQTHQILKAWSFRFTYGEGGERAERQTEQRPYGREGDRGNSQKTVWFRGNNTLGTLGGRHMRRDGGRDRGTGRKHRKVRRGESECFLPNQVLALSRGCVDVTSWRLIGW